MNYWSWNDDLVVYVAFVSIIDKHSVLQSAKNAFQLHIGDIMWINEILCVNCLEPLGIKME